MTTTFERAGLWQISFISQNEHAPVRVSFAVIAGRVEQAVDAARAILANQQLLYPSDEYMLVEAMAIAGGVFVPLEGDEGKKKAPDTTKGAEGKVLKMVPKPN